MFDRRSTKSELIDGENIPLADLIQNLVEFEIINHWLRVKKNLVKALNTVHLRYNKLFNTRQIQIVDLGCGGGDLLRAMEHWAEQKKINCSLWGIDNNSVILEEAKIKSNSFSKIHYENDNILNQNFKNKCFDIVCLNNVCHHFADEEIIELLRKLQEKTSLCIIINDLHRHIIAYYGIKLITKILNFSYLARFDGPLSVLRAFNKQELITIVQNSNATDFQIIWKWPFHWQIIIWCKKE